MSSLFILLILFVAVVLPLFFTLSNIVFVLRPGREVAGNKLRALVDAAGMVLGLILSMTLIRTQYDNYGGTYTKGLRLYTPVSGEHAMTIFAIVAVAILGFVVLRFLREYLSPLIFLFCLAAILIGVLLSIVYTIQIVKNFDINVFFLLLYPFNFVLCVIRLVRACVSEELKRLSEHEQNGVVGGCARLLTKSTSWLIAFALMLPLLMLLLGILVLMGQAPDSAIKAFTETSDWTLSQHDWPRLPTHDPHYLCTAALRGNRGLVKPLRYGIRGGERIVVNRQLCVANAFEQYIMEKTPRFHAAVRSFYDRYGYPLSKHITTEKRANATYILMKPLEWAFVLFLYTVDKKPENRIAMQYLPKIKIDNG